MPRVPRHRRRVLAEGLVIVVSILLAFALDAWWDLSRQKQEMSEVLGALDAEFSEVQVELDMIEGRNQDVIAAADAILNQLRSGDGGVPTALLGDLLRVPTTSSAQGALAALIASGRLDLVQSRELQTLLAGWSSVLQDVQEDEAAAERFVYGELLPYLTEVAPVGPALSLRVGGDPDGVVEIPTTDRMINLVETRRFHAVNVLYERDRLHVSQVVDRIRLGLRPQEN